MGVKTLLGGAASALALSATFAAADDITSCVVNGDGFGVITHEDGSVFTTTRRPLVSDGAIWSDDGSAGATKICDLTEGENNSSPNQGGVNLPLSDSYICAVEENGTALPYVAETGELDMTVSAQFLEQTVPNSLDATIGSCVVDGKEIAPAVPAAKISDYTPG